jgi:hypothetical protein
MVLLAIRAFSWTWGHQAMSIAHIVADGLSWPKALQQTRTKRLLQTEIQAFV